MSKQLYFVAGTDTDVGKTVVSVGLMQAFAKSGQTVVGIKPISAGCENTINGLRNDDAMLLQKNSTIELPYEAINPFAFAEPIAPHIAAANEKSELKKAAVSNYLGSLSSVNADVTIIEGAGGWHVPLNLQETYADAVVDCQIPVILVVALRLGCLNHAILTARSILSMKLPLAGWVANHYGSMPYANENIATLKQFIDAPCLGVVPKINSQVEACEHLNIDLLS